MVFVFLVQVLMLVWVIVWEGKCWGVGNGPLTTTKTNKQTHTHTTHHHTWAHTLSDLNNETKTETSTHMKGNRHTRFDQSSVVCGGVVCVGCVCVDPAEHVT